VRSKLFFAVPVILVALCLATPAGSFRGKIVATPRPDSGHKWIYIQALKGTLRRVDVSRASIRYGADVPKGDRRPNATESLREGAQIRVTASQDTDGEWRAIEVTIEALGR